MSTKKEEIFCIELVKAMYARKTWASEDISDTACLDEMCGYWSKKAKKCSIAVIGDFMFEMHQMVNVPKLMGAIMKDPKLMKAIMKKQARINP